MLLPLVLITSREAMKSVPDEYRDASAALGVSKWETIRSVVVPASMPGSSPGLSSVSVESPAKPHPCCSS